MRNELTSWEFIKAHLYDRRKSRRGDRVKKTGFSDRRIRKLIRLYRQDRNERPKAGELLLIAFREELEKRFGYGDRFGDGCADFLIGILDNKKAEYISRQEFLEQVTGAQVTE